MSTQNFEELIKMYREAVSLGGGPISPSCGLFLYIVSRLVASSVQGFARFLDIGCGYGVSTMYMAKAIADLGGSGFVCSIDINCNRCRYVYVNSKKLNLELNIDALCSDALNAIVGSRKFHLIFLDFGLRNAVPAIQIVRELLHNAGVLLIHDAILSVFQEPTAIKKLIENNFLVSIVPVDTGLTFAMPGNGCGVYTDILHLFCLLQIRRGFITVVVDNESRHTINRIADIVPKQILKIVNVSEEVLPSNLSNISMLIMLSYDYENYHVYLSHFEKFMKPNSLVIAMGTIENAHRLSKFFRAVYSSDKYLSITLYIDGGTTIALKL